MSIKSALKDARATLASLPLVAQGLAGRSGVKVIIDQHAQTASTNGKIIRLPPLPLPVKASDVETAKRLAILAYGYIPHEIGHVKHTDFDVFRKMAKLGPTEKTLLNVLEDPRIEAAQIAEFPGNRHHLDDLLELMVKEGSFPAITTGATPEQALSAYCLYYLRATVRGSETFRALCDASRPAVAELLGEGFLTRLDVLLSTRGKTLASTQDAADLAKAILRAAKAAAKDPPPQQAPQGQQQGQPQASSEPSDDASGDDQGDPSDDASGNGSDDDQADQGDDASDTGGSGDQGDPGDDASGNGSGGQGGPEDAQHQRQRQALEDLVNGNGGGNGMQDLGDMVAQEITKQASAVATNEFVYDDSSVSNQLASGASPKAPTSGGFNSQDALMVSSRLRAMLASKIQALTMQRTSEAVRGNKLNRRTLHRTSSGDRRIFLHEEERKALDTAVFLLCDISGSMGGVPLAMASQALFAASVAMSQLTGVTSAVGVFPVFAMVNDFGQSPRAMTEKFALQATGGTPMAQGLLWASRKLAVRREARKILLVATDGDPDCLGSAQAQVEALTRRGFEVLGLGIQHPNVANVFPKHAVINTLNEMPKALLGMLSTTLHQQLQVA